MLDVKTAHNLRCGCVVNTKIKHDHTFNVNVFLVYIIIVSTLL